MSEDLKLWEGSLYHRSALSKSWKSLWAILKGKSLYLFKYRQNCNLNCLVGDIQLDDWCEIRFPRRDSLSFSLFQKSSTKENIQHYFTCQTKADREIWKAFIVGLAQGIVPKDLNWSILLPGQRRDLVEFVDLLESGVIKAGPSTSTVKKSSRLYSVDSGTSSSIGSSVSSFDDATVGWENPALGHDGDLTKFTWFFENIDRRTGEQVLTAGRLHGNVLLRRSISCQGNFVIQFRAVSKWVTAQFYNFLIKRMEDGYCLIINDADIPQSVWQAAMTPRHSLLDVIDFFLTDVARYISVVEPKMMYKSGGSSPGLRFASDSSAHKRRTSSTRDFLPEDRIYSEGDVFTRPLTPGSPASPGAPRSPRLTPASPLSHDLTSQTPITPPPRLSFSTAPLKSPLTRTKNVSAPTPPHSLIPSITLSVPAPSTSSYQSPTPVVENVQLTNDSTRLVLAPTSLLTSMSKLTTEESSKLVPSCASEREPVRAQAKDVQETEHSPDKLNSNRDDTGGYMGATDHQQQTFLEDNNNESAAAITNGQKRKKKITRHFFFESSPKDSSYSVLNRK